MRHHQTAQTRYHTQNPSRSKHLFSLNMIKQTLGLPSLVYLGAAAMLFASSCSSDSRTNGMGQTSGVTGWNYNDKTFGGYDVADYPGQQTGPGLVFVEGGRFTMGMTEDEIPGDRNNIPRTVSVSSFYMDQTEVANVHYREYLYWLQRAYSADYPNLIEAATPDSTVWRSALSYNEPQVKYYFRHAAYNYYPVVGVNWHQAQEFCQWRSDRVNELILIKNGILKKNVNQVNEDVYATETYTNGQYDGTAGPNRKRDLDPNGSGRRNVNMSDGYILPDYRLPTEAEWEYAALGNIANNPEPGTRKRRGEEVNTNRNTYTWGDPNSVRSGVRNQAQGEILANFMRGRGDAGGVAGSLNDNAIRTAPVNKYAPNGYGLYNMAGNVNEWVMDTYRPVTDWGNTGVDVFRGNVFETYKRIAEDNTLEEKDSTGHIPKRQLAVGEMDSLGRRLPRTTDLRDYSDGDTLTNTRYAYDPNRTLIDNSAKVYKGGSWADRAYWLVPGTRRFLDSRLSSATIGFRCVMDRLGSPNGRNDESAGNDFGSNKPRRRR